MRARGVASLILALAFAVSAFAQSTVRPGQNGPLTVSGILTQPTLAITNGSLTRTVSAINAGGVWSTWTWSNADITTLGASLTGDITVATLPALTRVVDAQIVNGAAATGGVKAQGTITMSGVAVAEETFVIGAQTFTWKASRAGAGQITIGTTAAIACTNIIAAVTADLTAQTATQGSGTTVIVTHATIGTAGNAITFTESSTNMAVDGGGTLGTTTAGEDLTTLTVSLGRAATTYLDYLGNGSIMAAANTVYGDAVGERGANLTGYEMPSLGSTTAVKLHVIATGTNLANVTGSSGTIRIKTETLP